MLRQPVQEGHRVIQDLHRHATGAKATAGNKLGIMRQPSHFVKRNMTAAGLVLSTTAGSVQSQMQELLGFCLPIHQRPCAPP